MEKPMGKTVSATHGVPEAPDIHADETTCQTCGQPLTGSFSPAAVALIPGKFYVISTRDVTVAGTLVAKNVTHIRMRPHGPDVEIDIRVSGIIEINTM